MKDYSIVKGRILFWFFFSSIQKIQNTFGRKNLSRRQSENSKNYREKKASE